MVFSELEIRRLVLRLTQSQMARFLGVALSTYKGWGQRDQVPEYIVHSVEAHLLLSFPDLQQLKKMRKV